MAELSIECECGDTLSAGGSDTRLTCDCGIDWIVTVTKLQTP